MAIKVILRHDPTPAFAEAHAFLSANPVLHNQILTLLHTRIAYPEPGRYWLATDRGTVVGFVLQSPLTVAANLATIPPDAIPALVDAIAGAGITLPGVNGEAATAARFAGQWTERCKSAAVPFQGLRIYELSDLNEPPSVPGRLRNALPIDRALIVDWTHRFNDDVGGHAIDPEALVDRWLPAGHVWVWDTGQPVSMAVSRESVEGVVRVVGVYTPRDQRGRGYAEACVNHLSRHLRALDHRCILYTDLANPTSNSIYRRIGYRVVAEALRYRFLESDPPAPRI